MLTITTTHPDGTVEVDTWQEVTSLEEEFEWTPSLLAVAGVAGWRPWPVWSGRPKLPTVLALVRRGDGDDAREALKAWDWFRGKEA